jgi:hypothetical protein
MQRGALRDTSRKESKMSYQNINATISPVDLQAVKDAVAVVLAKLPFLVNLTSAERQSIVKTGPTVSRLCRTR